MILIFFLVLILIDILFKTIFKTKIINNFLFFLSCNIFFLFSNLKVSQKYIFLIPALIIFFLYSFLFTQIFPTKTNLFASISSRIVFGGRSLIYKSFFAIILQIFFSLNYSLINSYLEIPYKLFLTNNIIAFIFILFTFLNGYFRIYFFSFRLRLTKRILILFMIWIPVVNIFVFLHMCYLAKSEYDFSLYKNETDIIRKTSSVCKTKYPILFLHGFGFRDLKYFNYWGRIPKTLIKNGASLYYGHQEALGTIEKNGSQIKNKINEIVNTTGCEKVNIIAHSKGGLDARHTATTLEMSPYIASITTISTPHRGSILADVATKKLPAKMIKAVGKIFDKHMKKIGDVDPNFCDCVLQLTKNFADQFNKYTPDCSNIYYQSYSSTMSSPFSNFVLSIPYFIISLYDKQNDGLVTIESAKWGDFKKNFSTRKVRGISHGDIIDLEREDIKNFHVTETYVEIVSNLKNMGF